MQVCPMATINAPLELVWALIVQPQPGQPWMGGRVDRLDPPGPLHAGQVVVASDGALGRRWPVPITVEAVDATQHVLHVRVVLPFGIANDQRVSCQVVDASTCRVLFG